MSVGERPLLMTEQLALQQSFREGGTVHGNEKMPGSGPAIVQSLGGDFFSGSTLAGDEDRQVGSCEAFDRPAHRLDRGAFANDGRAAGDAFGQLAIAAEEQVPLLAFFDCDGDLDPEL